MLRSLLTVFSILFSLSLLAAEAHAVKPKKGELTFESWQKQITKQLDKRSNQEVYIFADKFRYEKGYDRLDDLTKYRMQEFLYQYLLTRVEKQRTAGTRVYSE